MRRFARWLALPELEPPIEVPAGRVIDLAVDNGRWRGVALFIGERQGWTAFHDMTGYLAATAIDEWLRLAENDELVFAGYNDAISWAALIVIRCGQVVREFREAAEAPEENTDRGSLELEGDARLHSWIDVAGFVDEDELGYEPEQGFLWQFQRPVSLS